MLKRLNFIGGKKFEQKTDLELKFQQKACRRNYSQAQFLHFLVDS